jgi:hypothetical protein
LPGGGILNVHALASASVSGPTFDGLQYNSSSVTAEAIAAYSDSLLFHNVGTPGTPFHVSGYWNLSGSTGASASSTVPTVLNQGRYTYGSSTAYLKISGLGVDQALNGQIIAQDTDYNLSGQHISSEHDEPENKIFVSFDGFAGTPVPLLISLDAYAQASAYSNDYFSNAGAASICDADFSHTLAWGGITSVTDGSKHWSNGFQHRQRQRGYVRRRWNWLFGLGKWGNEYVGN